MATGSEVVPERSTAASDLAGNSAMAHLDMIRGVAALAVMVSHVRPLFFVNRNELTTPPSRVLDALYVLTGFGHQAVIVFFVLSGFLIGSSVLRSHRAGTWSWGNYLLRRLTRLELVLLPALVLTAVLDGVGMHFFGVDNAYGGALNPAMVGHSARESVGILSFLGNVAFLQSIAVQPYGTNQPLWSLGYELWSYILFPLLVAVGVGSCTTRARLVGAALALLIAASAGTAFLAYFGIWLLGVGVSIAYGRLKPRRPATSLVVASWMGVGTGYALARGSQLSGHVSDYVSALATSALLLVLLLRGRWVARPDRDKGYAGISARLAGFSYTLYLVHYPVAALVSAGLVGSVRWQPTEEHLATSVAVCAAIVAVSYGLASMTERHTQAMRRYLVLLLASVRVSAAQRLRAPRS